MSRKEFGNGSVLLTGDDMIAALEAAMNRRGAHEIDCDFCQHEGDDEYCYGCSIAGNDYSCSCHINAPCSKCVDSKFEVSPYLVNFLHHKEGKKRWQCFKADKNIFDKATAIENIGLEISAEIICTGEVAMFIDDGVEAGKNDCIEICSRKDFKAVMCRMIESFQIEDSEQG